ncbi:MAG: primosomal protein N' [Clostridia bacterium]|nr:primosomal protein N' [Clostridia bacterium]
MDNRYVKLHLLDNPYCIDTEYTYFVPHDLSEAVVKGTFAVVPFGKSNKTQIGLVTADHCEEPKLKTKSIKALASSEIRLSQTELELCFFMKEQTLCTIGDAVHAMIPAGALSQLVVCYRIAPGATYDGPLSDIFHFIEDARTVTEAEITREFGLHTPSALSRLVRDGVIEKDVTVKSMAVGKEKKYYLLDVSNDQLASLLGAGEPTEGYKKLRSEMHRSILSLLSMRERMIAEDIKAELGASDAQISALFKKGFIRIETESVYRNPYENKKRQNHARALTLSKEQEVALAKIQTLFDAEKPACALLHGVTGSGKTSVMMKIIDRALSRGKGVIMLIPEISLTPQTVELFCSRYGSRVAIIHSSLSGGERLDAYMRIKRGDADLVIGTRSAVFAPVQDLGLIIIDEEQEHTYKSDNNPKYHARDIARFRSAKTNSLLLLASATPSVESYQKAVEGKYTLVELTERYGKAKLPKVKLADMREELRAGNTGALSLPLLDGIGTALHKKEQTILFLNRRGYHNFVSCASCGKAITCPNCSVSMTHHTDRLYHKAELVCHFCGKRMPVPAECPECGSAHIKPMGIGIQLVEQQLKELYPSVNVIRMDTDTTSSKNAYEEMLDDFRSHRAEILLGTQMVTKGHDFPDVTLVGVLNADTSLYLNDYRANERTFSMLTQVIGRAGRSEKEGVALIQTSNPDHDVISLACRQDYKSFFANEIKMRKLLSYPPFCDIVLLTLSGQVESAVLKDSKLLYDMLKGKASGEFSDVPLICYGPFEAPVYKLDGRYRIRIVIKTKLNKRAREMFSQIYSEFGKRKKNEPQLSVDLNPSSL